MGVAVDVAACYRRYGPMVVRRCRRLLGDEELAWEACQDTFVRLLRYEGRLEDRGLSSLLHRMATNVCLNQLRTRRRRPEVPDSALLQRIAATCDPEPRSVARGLLRRLFRGVPASSGTIAVLHLVDGMTHAEVAREVGMSVSGVRKRLRVLKARLQEIEGGP